MPTYFKTRNNLKLKLPLFFPDATRAFVKAVDSEDLRNTKTPGILVNTYHLYKDVGSEVIKKFAGVRRFMNWDGAIISDSGGFQIMSLIKSDAKRGIVTDEGVTFKPFGEKAITLTPEVSIRFQMELNTDLVVVLDDFTPPNAKLDVAKDTVRRTILWAVRSKREFLKICEEQKIKKSDRPYIIGVVQGGDYLDLRKECTKRLVEIGFDGLGYGGWPVNKGNFNYDVAKTIAEHTPKDYFLYGLGIGKPHEIVECFKLGYTIFDCVLPTRDARHKRLYIYNATSIDEINVYSQNFYSYYFPDKERYYKDTYLVDSACDCLLCTKYSRAYLAHLFKSKEVSALRLATIHNLRFYSILMEKLQK